MLMQARDEAHRFAVTFHRQKRGKAMTRSALDDIPGIGTVRRQNLLRAFGSFDKIGAGSVDDLAAVKGIGMAAARKIHEFLHPPDESTPESGT